MNFEEYQKFMEPKNALCSMFEIVINYMLSTMSNVKTDKNIDDSSQFF